MKIKWFSISSFLITTDSGLRVITDPYFQPHIPLEITPYYRPSDTPPVSEHADVVMISHRHADHSFPYAIKGIPRLYMGGQPLEFKGAKFSGVATLHDNYGSDTGTIPLPANGLNSILCLEADDLRICHMGDYGLQERLYDKQLAIIGRVDILMTPWGRFIPGILNQLKPKVVLPMHHTTIDQVKDMKGFTDLTEKTSELEFTSKTLPEKMKVIMLKAALE